MIDYGKLLHHDMIFVCAAVQQMIFRGDTFACISREREREKRKIGTEFLCEIDELYRAISFGGWELSTS